MDPRYSKLAHTLVHHSTRVKSGDHVLLDLANIPEEMTLALMRELYQSNAQVFIDEHSSRLSRELLSCATPEYWEIRCELELQRMRKMDVYIALRGSKNIFETSDVPEARMKAALQAMKPLLDERVNTTRWVILRWPSPSMAQQAALSTEAFEDLFFKVCTLDYASLQEGAQALKALMDKTDRVRIEGPGETHLSFSIKDIPAIACTGTHNLPDGEVFTAPVKESVEGVIHYNTPTLYQGKSFNNVRLRFKKGQIVEASADDNTPALNAILDSDPGARYIGEFALGFNPHIQNPMRDILFDEKIAGSFHFTPGQAYEEADNTNRSQVHWDLVCIQRKDYGGGSIFFDDTLVRKDGRFLPELLQSLNA